MQFSIHRLLLGLALFGIAQLSANDTGVSSWQPLPDMPTPRFNLSAVAVNDKLYAIGGAEHDPNNRTISFPANEQFDPAKNRWIVKHDMPTARFSLGVSAEHGKIYALGGHKGQASYSAVEEYNAASDKWENRIDMPTPRTAFATAVVKGKLYVIGGTAMGVPKLAVIEEYDPATDKWARKRDLPNPRSSFAAAVVNDKIYVFGGRLSGDEYQQEHSPMLEEYDPATDTWTRKADIPTPRFQLAGAALNGKIYAIGGRTQAGPSTLVEQYDPQTDKWTRAPDLPVPLAGAAAVGMNGKLYVVGGRTGIPSHGIASAYAYAP